MTELVYCDASALVSRVGGEESSLSVGAKLDAYARAGRSLISCAIAAVEVHRAIARRLSMNTLNGSAAGHASAAFTGITLMDVNQSALQMAIRIPGIHLGTLDAIHVACAVLSGADIVVTRDRRMAQACEAVGLAVA